MKRSSIGIYRSKVTVASILLNALGAGLTFVYFTFIGSGLRPDPTQPDVRTQTSYFIVVMIVVFSVVMLISLRYPGRLWGELAAVKDEPDPRRVNAVVGRFLNLPLSASALSLFAWLSAGILYSLLPQLFDVRETAQWYRSYRYHIFFGIVFVGAPFTVICQYFVMEWMTRTTIRSLFPPSVLATIPHSIHLNVLPKILLASLLIGTAPVTIISYVTLSQIHQVQAGVVDMGSFIERMPVVIGFLLSLAVVFAVVLSIFVARRIVSEPLNELRSAMDGIRKGDLDVSIPVVSSDEIGFMADGFNRMVEGLRERNFIRDTFGSYLSPEVVSEILSSPKGVNLGGELRDVTVLVADLRGFTSLTAAVAPEVVVTILNRFLEKMVEIIVGHGGTIDEFTGDGVLAFFGAPRRMNDAPKRAVQCSIDMQKAMNGLSEELKRDLTARLDKVENQDPGNSADVFAGQPALQMGIAINKGQLIVGNIGCEQRRKYGAVGTPINVAFRMEHIARGGEILLSGEVYKSVGDMVEAHPLPEIELKGIEHAFTLYSIVP